MRITKTNFLLFNFILRLILVYLSQVIDNMSKGFKYTDADYYVFSDAATKVYEGKSPFERHTYRYTPIVAYICTVNNYIHPLSAKVVFCICDILMGLIIWKIVKLQNVQNKGKTLYYVAFLLLNPLIVTLSTRGSNDNMITMVLFVAIYFLLKRQYILAGIFYGFSVHLKIYPIIYSIVFYFYIDNNK